MATDRTNKQIKLKDGRMLGYSEYGTPEGKPVFYFHGHPGSRLDWPLFFDDDDSAVELNARIIAVDRPGTGLSDFKRGREILDWPDDVIEIADALKVDRFAVLGISGGGPYAAACAFKIPGRLTATAIVSGMGPAEAPGTKDGLSWIYAGKSPVIRRLLLMMTTMGIRKKPDKFISKMKETLKGPDGVMILDQPELLKGTVDNFSEALRPGIAGVHHEAGLYARPWGFRLQDITAEVHLWHGEQDDNVPVSVGRYVAGAIPKCRAKFIENEGHLTLISKYVREYLSILVA
jgi:pimeloyl-ACP methyl ester carboxylesterase